MITSIVVPSVSDMTFLKKNDSSVNEAAWNISN